MLKSAEYVIENSVQIAIDFYNEVFKKNRSAYTATEAEEIKTIYNKCVSAKSTVSQFRATGDLYIYLTKATKPKNLVTAIMFRKYKLVPFEDIMANFEKKFSSELKRTWSFKELVVGNSYSLFDILVLSQCSDPRSYGILASRDINGAINGVVVRGEFGFSNSSNNYWLSNDECVYHLINKKNKNNDIISSGEYPVHVFETQGEKRIYKGEFYFFNQIFNRNSVHLKRKFPHNKVGAVPHNTNYSLPTIPPFKKNTAKANATSSGTDQFGKNRSKLGRIAEKGVMEILKDKGFDITDVANDSKYPFDLLINDNGIGLEVKNIANGSFFISENEIRTFEDNKSRICFYDKGRVLISHKSVKCVELNNIFKELRAIDSKTKDDYHGKYECESIRIGIGESMADELIKDFTIVDEVSYSDIMDLLKV